MGAAMEVLAGPIAFSGTERQQIQAALRRARGNRAAAARLLGISRATFYRRLRTLGIDPGPEAPP
jgi:transcriptional regulator of acetoin/glycerol metabolism